MMKAREAMFLSGLAPNRMTPGALEATFVQREALTQRVVELIRDSTLTPSKHHTLLIGPRGTGKTHLLALLYHRLRAMDDLRGRLLIAWLREEEWGVTSFLDLLLRIFRALPAESGAPEISERVESLYLLPPEVAEPVGGTLLKELVGDRTLLLLMENLDDLFAGLGEEGQRRLRAYLQENPFCTILATAPSLFGGVSLQTSPFYGFFRIHHLEELDLDDAVRLLAKIVHLQGDRRMASFLSTPRGRARIRAVHHLVGGNHRVYAILSQFLTRESLDGLVEPFLRTLDELTPYYQARMAWLSSQQRKIVAILCDRGHAVPVKEIAQRGFMTHQTVSSQLKLLREMGYVHSIPIGRDAYYELRDPLMRLCFEARGHRSEAVRRRLDFLRAWYSRAEFMGGPTPGQRPEEALTSLDRAIERKPNTAQAWSKRGLMLGSLGRYEEALTSFDRASELGERSSQVLFGRAGALLALNRWDEGLAALDDALRRFSRTDGPEVGILGEVFYGLLAGTYDALAWQARISRLIALYDQHQAASVLAQGIVESVSALASPFASSAAARMWRDKWQRLVGHHAGFQLPLRLLDAAVRYRETYDPRVLLALPAEERSLLEPLLGTEEPS